MATAGVLLVRCWVMLRLADTPFWDQNHGDSAYYLAWAARVAAGQWTDGQAFLGLPLYPYALALLQWAQFPFPWSPLALQALFDALTGGLLFGGVALSTENWRSPAAQVAAASAAVGWALFIPAQAFSSTLMPNPPATTVYTAGLLSVLLLRRRVTAPSLRLISLLGFLLGFGALLSANLLFLLPVFLATCWRASERRLVLCGAGRAALLCTGLLLGSSPAWVHNYLIAGEPVALSAHGGINFYLGNNPRATGYPSFPPGMRASQQGLLEDSARLAEAQLGRPLRRFEVSAFWSAEAHKFISENPSDWMRVMFAKIRNYYSCYEYDDISVIRPLAFLNVTTPGWSFGWMIPAAAAGLVLGWRRDVTRWAAVAVLLHTVSVLPAFVTERYRLMAAPALLLVAVSGLLAGWEERRTLSWTRAAVALSVAGVAGWVAVSAPRPAGVDTLGDYNAAVRLLAAGRRDLALPLVECLEQNDQTNSEAALLLGNFWQEAGEPGRAMKFYRRAIELNPSEVRAWNNATVLAIRRRDWTLANQLLAHLQKLAPADSRVRYYAAQLALAQRDFVRARQEIDQALQLRPREPLYLELSEDLAKQQKSASP